MLLAPIGHDPSLRDVLRLARPTPKDNGRRALFGWLTDMEVDTWAPATEADLPEQVLAVRMNVNTLPRPVVIGLNTPGSMGCSVIGGCHGPRLNRLRLGEE